MFEITTLCLQNVFKEYSSIASIRSSPRQASAHTHIYVSCFLSFLQVGILPSLLPSPCRAFSKASLHGDSLPHITHLSTPPSVWPVCCGKEHPRRARLGCGSLSERRFSCPSYLQGIQRRVTVFSKHRPWAAAGAYGSAPPAHGRSTEDVPGKPYLGGPHNRGLA